MNINSNPYHFSELDQASSLGVISNEKAMTNSDIQQLATNQQDPRIGWNTEGFNTPIIDVENPQGLQLEVSLGKDVEPRLEGQLKRTEQEGQAALKYIKKEQFNHVTSDTIKLSSKILSLSAETPSSVQDLQDSSSDINDNDEFNMDNVEHGTDTDQTSLVQNQQSSSSDINDNDEFNMDNVEHGTNTDTDQASLVQNQQSPSSDINDNDEFNMDNVEHGTNTDTDQTSSVQDLQNSSSDINDNDEFNMDNVEHGADVSLGASSDISSEVPPISNRKGDFVKANSTDSKEAEEFAKRNSRVSNHSKKSQHLTKLTEMSVLPKGKISREERREAANKITNISEHYWAILSNEDLEKVKKGEKTQLRLTTASAEMLSDAAKVNELAKEGLLVRVKESSSGELEFTQVSDNSESSLEKYRGLITQVVLEDSSGNKKIFQIENIKFERMTIAEAMICIEEARQALGGKAKKTDSSLSKDAAIKSSSIDYETQKLMQQVQTATSNLSNFSRSNDLNRRLAEDTEQIVKEHRSQERKLHESKKNLEIKRQENELAKAKEDQAQFSQRQETIHNQKDTTDIHDQSVKAQESGKKISKKIMKKDRLDPEKIEEIIGTVDNTDPNTVKETRSI